MKSAATPRAPAGRPGTRERLERALELHRSGQLDQAEAGYRQVLHADPRQVDALHLLGALMLTRGDVAQATQLLQRAVRSMPRHGASWLTLGNAELAAGALPAAATAYEEALRLEPGSAAALSNLGHVRRLQGDRPAALRALEAAVSADDRSTDARINLGLVHHDDGRFAEAIGCFNAALALDPTSVAAAVNLAASAQAVGELDLAVQALDAAHRLTSHDARIIERLATALQLAGRNAEAVDRYQQAVLAGLADVSLLTNFGVALTKVGRFDDAMEIHDRAVRIAPDEGDLWLNRSAAAVMAERGSDAVASATRACELLPDSPAAWTTLGTAFAATGLWSDAVYAHERAVIRDPAFADGHWNLALALLASGSWETGWDQFAWRFRTSNAVTGMRPYPIPLWQGEPLGGRRILVWREQGIGDELLYATCIPDLVAAGATVTLFASPRLETLFRRAFPAAEVVADLHQGGGSEGRWDCHSPLGSLPRWLRRKRRDFPAQGAYLVSDPARQAQWRKRLDELGPGRSVGLCWRSGLLTPERRRHYAPLLSWARLLAVPGIKWISLQYDECADELATLEQLTGIRVHRWPGEDLKNDLDSVAALTAVLDGIVTAPTAVSSIGGAVGARTWQVDSGSDWTIGGERASPWFPTVDVVPRRAGESWDAVIDRVAEAFRSSLLGDGGPA